MHAGAILGHVIAQGYEVSAVSALQFQREQAEEFLKVSLYVLFVVWSVFLILTCFVVPGKSSYLLSNSNQCTNNTPLFLATIFLI